jgi:hypothetical protein
LQAAIATSVTSRTIANTISAGAPIEAGNSCARVRRNFTVHARPTGRAVAGAVVAHAPIEAGDGVAWVWFFFFAPGEQEHREKENDDFHKYSILIDDEINPERPKIQTLRQWPGQKVT